MYEILILNREQFALRYPYEAYEWSPGVSWELEASEAKELLAKIE